MSENSSVRAFALATAVVMALTPLTGCMDSSRLDGEGDGGGEEWTMFEWAEYTLVRNLTLTASANGLDYGLRVPRPPDLEDAQSVRDVRCSPEPTLTLEYGGLTWMQWNGSIEEGSSTRVSIECDVRVQSRSWDISVYDSGPVEDIPIEFDRYLGREWLIDPEDPDVMELSSSIVGSRTSVCGILLAVYEWMRENVIGGSYYSGHPQEPGETIAIGSGDEDDQAVLFASLARAAGVPVWLDLGLSLLSDGRAAGGCRNLVVIPLLEGGHAVATIDLSRRQFLFSGTAFVSDYIDDGDGAALRDYYTSWEYSYRGVDPEATSTHHVSVTGLDAGGSVTYRPP